MSTQRYDTISFLSDYGTSDEFAGVVKSVIRSIAPHVTVIDITHDVPAFDVRAGSLTLMRAAHYLCPGVVLAVVDPEVGSDRRAIAVEVGEGESVLVGPDNGLLAPATALVGGARRAVQLDRTEFHLDVASNTFDGRDVFAPVTAHLCNGVAFEELGTSIDVNDLAPGLVPFSTEHDGVIDADVLWVDHFGNAQLDVTPGQVSPLGDRMQIEIRDHELVARRVVTFADLDPGEPGLVVDSSGLIALVLDKDSAAARFGVAERDSVRISTLGVERPQLGQPLDDPHRRSR